MSTVPTHGKADTRYRNSRSGRPRKVSLQAVVDDGDNVALPAVVVAEIHAELLTYARTEGVPLGAHDLIIAATARATGRTLVTTDRTARFDELPGVSTRLVG